jgi:hypothetical protein
MRKTVVATAAILAAVAIWAPAASAQEPAPEPTRCDGTLTGFIAGDALVPFLRNCVIQNAFVTGDVTTQVRARSLRIERAIVLGNVSCDDCGRIELTRAAIGGAVEVQEPSSGARVCRSLVGGNADFIGVGSATTSGVVLGDTASGCSGSLFGQTLTVRFSLGASSIERNLVSRDALIESNRGGVAVSSNVVGGSLTCNGNDPAPTGGGNLASEKVGQCAEL